MLQEKLQAERRPAPRYSVVEAVGPPHRRTFHVEVSWDNGSVRAEGRSIKTAEAAAAKEALAFMRASSKKRDSPSKRHRDCWLPASNRNGFWQATASALRPTLRFIADQLDRGN